MNAFTKTTRAILMAFSCCLALVPDTGSAQSTSTATSTHNQSTHNVEERTLQLSSGESFTYLFITPASYSSSQPYPTLIALSPGKATRPLVDEALKRYWIPLVEQYQFVIAAPISPFSIASTNYFTENPRAVFALSDELNGTLKITGGRQYLAGISSGGAAAANTFLHAPGQFASLTLLPGLLETTDFTPQQLSRLSGKRITYFVGENDATWHEANESTLSTLLSAGAEASIIPIPQQGHVLTLSPALLHGAITGTEPPLPVPASSIPKQQPPPSPPSNPHTNQASMGAMKPMAQVIITNPIQPDPVKNLKTIDAVDDARTRAISAVLNDFHDAASKADENRYFNHFTPDAVFIGTDAKERWTYSQFRAYAKPHFDAGTGWSYTATSRNIFLSPNADVAWFDEMLENKKYGTCRGTGVLIKVDQIWRISQYHLVIPVPNELVADLMKLIADSNNETK